MENGAFSFSRLCLTMSIVDDFTAAKCVVGVSFKTNTDVKSNRIK